MRVKLSQAQTAALPSVTIIIGPIDYQKKSTYVRYAAPWPMLHLFRQSLPRGGSAPYSEDQPQSAQATICDTSNLNFGAKLTAE